MPSPGRTRIFIELDMIAAMQPLHGRPRDAIPFIQALAAKAPERLVWGPDWPNIGFHSGGPASGDAVTPYRELDAGELLDLLAEAVPDVNTRRAILARNPERPYGFA